jgi:hypothetical protein
MDELTHHGTDDTHLALASLAQAFSPLLEERAAPESCDGREVERTPEPSIADL